MGNSRYDAGITRSYMSNTASRTASDYRSYRDSEIDKKYDPVNIKVRESRKSVLNPNPTPIIVALDDTGSMGRVVEAMRKGLGKLFEQIIERSPVSDPHALAMFIGDFDYDDAPVQATQFEADPVTIGKQIEELRLEGGGGGNQFEGYLGPLYFALNRTACDAFKEGRKGYLFTVGDEYPQKVITRNHVKEFFGDNIPEDLSAGELVEQVSKDWNYFHLIVMEGSHASSYPGQTLSAWSTLIGQRAIKLTDHRKMPEVITSLIEVTSGRDKDVVGESWDKTTNKVVVEAVKNVPAFPSLDL